VAEKIRLDQILVQRGLAKSREKAKAVIMAGLVEVNGQTVDKAGRLISPSAAVNLKEGAPPYVSRGGQKLEAAIDHFGIHLEGRVMLDVGASTGGFTDCLLKHGASRVIAVDVGYGQLDWKLRRDKRVRVLERTNIRHLGPQDLKEQAHGAVIDVSFISLRLVLPAVSRLLVKNAFVVPLIKPQFEVGKGQVGKGGVVRDPELHRKVIEDLSGFFMNTGWQVGGHIPSPLLGPKGNREFLMYLSR
jgi:23S rRNA (cytidine1920-2'-O)/16S rRNA (cytidine1409-2'-O)-methyltransferase